MDSEPPVLLVVEDDFLVRLTLVDALSDDGFEVLEAADAQEALDHVCGRSDIAAMLTDINLPGGIGRLRARAGGAGAAAGAAGGLCLGTLHHAGFRQGGAGGTLPGETLHAIPGGRGDPRPDGARAGRTGLTPPRLRRRPPPLKRDRLRCPHQKA
ncbi:response regulator [Siccirubricoccus sp. G192]|nr:response regulator [Siccirubricoccus sp. G192]